MFYDTLIKNLIKEKLDNKKLGRVIKITIADLKPVEGCCQYETVEDVVLAKIKELECKDLSNFTPL